MEAPSFNLHHGTFRILGLSDMMLAVWPRKYGEKGDKWLSHQSSVQVNRGMPLSGFRHSFREMDSTADVLFVYWSKEVLVGKPLP